VRYQGKTSGERIRRRVSEILSKYLEKCRRGRRKNQVGENLPLLNDAIQSGLEKGGREGRSNETMKKSKGMINKEGSKGEVVLAAPVILSEYFFS